MVYDKNGKELTTGSYFSKLRLTSETLYSSIGSGVQSAFVTGSGKVWMIRENGTCYVVQNGTILTTITLDHSIGHANSANYNNGYAYISDWTDGTLIHVFSVSDANNTMAWVKDIVMPITYGRGEFFVFDSENQIYSINCNVTHSQDSQYYVVALWKKGTDGNYAKAKETILTGITVPQGMCVYNGRLYIITNTSSYYHIGIVILDLATGEQIIDTSQTGTILTLETEGIVPMSDNTFLVVGYNGSQFLLTESYSE